MNQNILNELTTGLLDGGYLDLEFLVDVIEQYKLSVDDILDQVDECFGEQENIKINYLIYTALTMVAREFMGQNPELFEEYSDEYFIFTNYMDSHIYFKDEEVQNEFEKF